MVLSIYILKLEENKWYVGKTYRKVKERFQEHLDGKGSSWTKKYKPIERRMAMLKMNGIGVGAD
jgi:predicted GIY-YIG superfamily endonuclease